MNLDMTHTHTGTLYLVPAPLDFGCDIEAPLTDSLPLGSLKIAARLTHWICENAKTTRHYLKRVSAITPLALPLQQLSLVELPHEVHKKGDHGGSFDARALLAPASMGHDIGLVSEAGMPAVADPGSSVVRAAHDLGMHVAPLVGPSALLLSLAASGLHGQSFAFVGYLPLDSGERIKRIKELEATALKTGQAQICIETPYRNPALLAALIHTLQANTRLAVCAGLTLPQAQLHSQPVKQWRQSPKTLPSNLPAVFVIGR